MTSVRLQRPWIIDRKWIKLFMETSKVELWIPVLVLKVCECMEPEWVPPTRFETGIGNLRASMLVFSYYMITHLGSLQRIQKQSFDGCTNRGSV